MKKAIFAAALASLLTCATLGTVESRQKGEGRTHIKCPVDEVRAEITTSLPEPWFQTPQVGRLERTRVELIGGTRTLVCEYWGYGRRVNVMREAPGRCVAVRGGFVCA